MSNYKGKSTGHVAANGACLMFKVLVNKEFMQLKMSLLAYFNFDGSFVLYPSIAPESDRIVMSNAILNDFLVYFAHHNVTENTKDATGDTRSIRRDIWDKILAETPVLSENLLDDMIAVSHRTLESIKLIADSKQVQAMAKGVAVRKKESRARTFDTISLVVGKIF